MKGHEKLLHHHLEWYVQVELYISFMYLGAEGLFIPSTRLSFPLPERGCSRLGMFFRYSLNFSFCSKISLNFLTTHHLILIYLFFYEYNWKIALLLEKQ